MISLFAVSCVFNCVGWGVDAVRVCWFCAFLFALIIGCAANFVVALFGCFGLRLCLWDDWLFGLYWLWLVACRLLFCVCVCDLSGLLLCFVVCLVFVIVGWGLLVWV